MESKRFHGPNVGYCEVISGGKQNSLIGVYPPPRATLDKLPDLEEALEGIWDQYPIVLGGLNEDIGQSQSPCSQYVADILMEFGLVELLCHFW